MMTALLVGLFVLLISTSYEFEGPPRPGIVVRTVTYTLALLPFLLPLAFLSSLMRYWAFKLSHEPTKTTDLNDGLPYDPTLPQCRWHPKISPYRFTVFLTPVAIGTVKAVLSLTESVTTLITIVIFVV